MLTNGTYFSEVYRFGVHHSALDIFLVCFIALEVI